MIARLRQSEFPWEWCAVAAACLTDYAWARAIDFHLLLGWHDGLVIAILLGAFALFQLWAPARIRLVAEYFFLSLAGTAALIVFSYLSLASAPGPLADPLLLGWDRALGFDWPSLYRLLMGHTLVAGAGRLIYLSLVVQGLYCTILLGLMRQLRQMRELWRLTFLASVMCCLIGMAFPALGPFKLFGLESQGPFLPDMEHLLSHHDLSFAAGSMTGVICFPSLHTAMALAYPYGLRRTGPVFYLFLALNFLMLFTIPFFGGHYLVDMIAGAGVMLVSLAVVRALDSRRRVTAAALAGQAA